jgi:hypothetical protein
LQTGRVPIQSDADPWSHGSAAAGGAGPSRFCVLDIEPEFADGIATDELPAARAAATAFAWLLPRGRWRSEPQMFEEREGLGFLVLDGLLARHLAIGGVEAVELVGPGDVLRPWVGLTGELSGHVCEHWMTARRARLADLDATFTASVAGWPTIAARINDRVARRVDWLALAMAVHGIRRIDDRLLMILWFYADRWGRMTPDGVILDLELTHSLLGAVIGARRPSVTTSLKALESAGALKRRSDGSWLLCGERPEVVAGACRPAQAEVVETLDRLDPSVAAG